MAVDHATIGTDFGKFLMAAENLRKFRDDTTGAGVTIKCVQIWLDDFETTFDGDATHKNTILPEAIAWAQGVRVKLNDAIVELFNGPVATWMTEYLRVQLLSSAQSIPDLMRDWGESMLTDSKDVLECSVVVGSVTADSDNAGDGTLTAEALEPLENRPNEVVHNETFTVRCTSDSFFNGVTPGQETFLASGTLHRGGIEIPVKHAEGIDANRITDGGFENWTTGALDSWTVVTGTATEIAQNTTNEIRGSSCVEIDGDGAEATIEIKQAETAFAGYSTTARLKPNRWYQISARIRTNLGTGVAASDNFKILFDGTGYSTGAGEQINIAGSDSSADAEYKATVQMPDTIPSDMALHIQYTGTPAAGAQVVVDDLVVQEFTIAEDFGLMFAITRGPTNDYRAGEQQDYFTFATTNDFAGVFQKWLVSVTDPSTKDIRTWPGINRMLPSASSAHSDYAESKAS